MGSSGSNGGTVTAVISGEISWPELYRRLQDTEDWMRKEVPVQADPWPEWTFTGWLRQVPREQKLRLWRQVEREMEREDGYPEL